MARNTGSKSTAPSRIRFVMVEAEIGDGDIGQITQAIQNALRSQTPVSTKRISAGPATTNDAEVPEIESEIGDVADETDIKSKNSASKAKSPRRPAPAPNVIEIDMNSPVSFNSFASGKDSSSQRKQYLIAAAWLKEHRGIDSVTANHIYTCFRSIGWSVGIPDFSQPLRNLKSDKFLVQNSNGEFEINHIGIDFVKKLGGGNAAS